MSSVCTYFIWLFQSFSEWRDGRKGRIAQSASVLRRGNEAAGIFSHSVRLRSQTCTSSSSTLSLIAKTNERLYILYFQTSPLDCAIATLRFKLSGSCYETVERLRCDVYYVSAGGNWDWGAADTSKSHKGASDRKVLKIHSNKIALLDFSMGPVYVSSSIIIPLVSLLLKVCRCSSHSGPQCGNVCAVCRHCRHVGLFVRKLGGTLRLFFHQHLVERCKPDFAALLQSALWGLTSCLS